MSEVSFDGKTAQKDLEAELLRRSREQDKISVRTLRGIDLAVLRSNDHQFRCRDITHKYEAQTGNMNSFENLTLLQKMLASWTGTEDRRLLIEFHEGAWDITESTFPHDTYHTARGTGVTFDAAWENMRQTWIP